MPIAELLTGLGGLYWDFAGIVGSIFISVEARTVWVEWRSGYKGGA